MSTTAAAQADDIICVADDMAKLCQHMAAQPNVGRSLRTALHHILDRWDVAKRRARPSTQIPLERRIGQAALTLKEMEVVKFFDAYRREKQISPTLEEIGRHFDTSRVTAFEQVQGLIQKGVLCRSRRFKSRNLVWAKAA